MGNYSGKTNLLKVKVQTNNPKEGLVEIIQSLDSDYEEYAEQIVDNIINDPKNDDVIEMIDAVICGRFGEVMVEEDGEEYNVLDDLSNWFLDNCTYCSGFESDSHHVSNKGEEPYELVIISYGN